MFIILFQILLFLFILNHTNYYLSVL